jgi:mRNA interferase RelE/StbE
LVDVKSVRCHPRALKGLARHRKDARRLLSKIEAYAADPDSQANNVKRLKGMPALFRLRVGDYRVIFAEDESNVTVLKVEPRGSVYD